MIFEGFGTLSFEQKNFHKKILNFPHQIIFSKIPFLVFFESQNFPLKINTKNLKNTSKYKKSLISPGFSDIFSKTKIVEKIIR